MATLDTNVLVRYLIADDCKQFEIARAFIESTIRNESLFLPISVVVELEWVLRSRYERSKSEIVLVLNHLLESGDVGFQDQASIEIALNLHAENSECPLYERQPTRASAEVFCNRAPGF